MAYRAPDIRAAPARYRKPLRQTPKPGRDTQVPCRPVCRPYRIPAGLQCPLPQPSRDAPKSGYLMAVIPRPFVAHSIEGCQFLSVRICLVEVIVAKLFKLSLQLAAIIPQSSAFAIG